MTVEKLKEMAIEVAAKAYAPYSNFNVGCALTTTSGNTYTGCNLENASYGLTTCAERNAIAKAVSEEGAIEIATIVIYTPTPHPTPPCGACRQTILEFGNPKVISFCKGEQSISYRADELLPKAFKLKKD